MIYETEKNVKENGDKLDDASKFITEIVSNIGETMLELADILGYGPEAIQKIKDYVVDLGTVDLKNVRHRLSVLGLNKNDTPGRATILDHLVVGGDTYFSFVDDNLL